VRFSVVVRDRSAGTEAVVLVDADPDATVAALLPALLGAVGSAIHPGFASKVPVWVDGRPVQPEDTARESGLAAGSVVCLHENDATPSTLPTGIVEVRVVSGPGAGRIHRARLGETVIGCGANGLSLPDPLLPADALTLTVARDGTATVQPADGIAATLDGTDLEGATQWPPGATLSAGQTLLTLEAPWQPDALTVAADGRLGRDVNRPPRLLPAPWIREFTLPHKPEKPTRMGIPWLMVLSPMLMAVPMVWLMGSWRFAAFALLSPIMAIFNLIQGRRSGAADYKRKLAAYESTLVKVRERAAEALARERTERRAALPDPAQVLLQAVGPGARLWERRRTDPDYLVLRVGTATRASQVRVEDPNVDRNAEDVAPATVADVPVPVALRDFGVLGVTGAADQVDATARWLIGQAAVLHSPRDLRLVVLTDQRGEDRLGWVRWLPHTRTDDETLPAFVGNEQQSIGARVGELTRLVTDRGAAAEEGFGAGAKEMTGPDYLVVLDGARLLRALPGVVTILRQGPAVGVRVICLDPDRRSLPEECRVVLECSDDESLVTATGVADVPEVRLDLVETAWAARVAQALAPLRDITPSLEDAGLPRSARLLECVGLTDPTPDAVVAGWGQPQTDVVIGAGFDGMFRIDLRRDGPHALVAGTTGSGKSELLQTIVASLALANRPDQLTFVLVDYKGGSAFKECNKLPHTVGMVTDLDTHLVGRALTSLGAELRRREHLLSVPGAKDLEDYWALCRN
jgi:S-DNA-T family DNA segregation ATPase FtsK/SpoIIIE